LRRESLPIKRLFVFKHKIYGPAELVAKDPQGLALVVFVPFFVKIHDVLPLGEGLLEIVGTSL